MGRVIDKRDNGGNPVIVVYPDPSVGERTPRGDISDVSRRAKLGDPRELTTVSNDRGLAYTVNIVCIIVNLRRKNVSIKEDKIQYLFNDKITHLPCGGGEYYLD